MPAMKSLRSNRKSKFASEAAIENLRNGSAAKFVAELDVVLSGFPGNIVDVMPVGVDALARVAIVGAQRGNAGHVDLGQPKIVGGGVGTAGVHSIQADAGGIEAAILGKNPSAKRFQPRRASLTMDGVMVET